jgi:hypothetical protein
MDHIEFVIGKTLFFDAFAAYESPATMTANDVDSVITSAIAAHVKYDLPRALNYSFNNIFDPNVTPGDLQPDFLVSNQTLQDSSGMSRADIYNAASGYQAVPLLPIVQQAFDAVKGITSGVISTRQQAWNEAISNMLPLEIDGTFMEPQPVLNDQVLELAGRLACSTLRRPR